MTSPKIKLSTLAVDPRDFLDKATLVAYLSGNQNVIREKNREIYLDGNPYAKEIEINGVYFCLTTFNENENKFTILSAYKAKPTQKKTYRYAFGYLSKGKVYMFYNAKSVATNRDQAVNVYNALEKYMEGQDAQVFAIKQ